MSIDVAFVDEQHAAIQEVSDSQQFLSSLALGQWRELKESVCLQFIDPFGDTVFNKAQMPILLAELEQSAAAQTDCDVKAHLQKVCRVVAAAQRRTHTYIKFIGD